MSLSSARGFAACSSISRFALSMANSRHGFYQTSRTRLLAVANKPFTSLSSTVQIKVRLIKTEKEFENVVINAMVKEGWGPRVYKMRNVSWPVIQQQGLLAS